MDRLDRLKAFKIILISVPVLFVLWIAGLFAGLKLTPALEEDFYVDGPADEFGGAALSQKITLAEPAEELMLRLRLW